MLFSEVYTAMESIPTEIAICLNLTLQIFPDKEIKKNYEIKSENKYIHNTTK